MHSGRNTTSVVLHPDRIAFKDTYVNCIAEASHGLVDTVVHDFVDKMMETAFGYVAYIHGRALAHRLKAFKDLDTICGILFFRLLHLFLINHNLL